jgi:hypothetical protein
MEPPPPHQQQPILDLNKVCAKDREELDLLRTMFETQGFAFFHPPGHDADPHKNDNDDDEGKRIPLSSSFADAFPVIEAFLAAADEPQTATTSWYRKRHKSRLGYKVTSSHKISLTLPTGSELETFWNNDNDNMSGHVKNVVQDLAKTLDDMLLKLTKATCEEYFGLTPQQMGERFGIALLDDNDKHNDCNQHHNLDEQDPTQQQQEEQTESSSRDNDKTTMLTIKEKQEGKARTSFWNSFGRHSCQKEKEQGVDTEPTMATTEEKRKKATFALFDAALYTNNNNHGGGDNIGDNSGDGANCAAHYDPGLYSLWIGESSPGLKLRDASGVWISPPPNILVVWLGQAAYDASDGRFRPGVHRVDGPAAGATATGGGGGTPRRLAIWSELCTRNQLLAYMNVLAGDGSVRFAAPTVIEVSNYVGDTHPFRVRVHDGDVSAALWTVSERLRMPTAKIMPMFRYDREGFASAIDRWTVR